MASTAALHLTPTERGELHAFLRKRNLPASVAQRMRIVLLLDEGSSYRDIEEKLERRRPLSRAGNNGINKMVCWGWQRSIRANRRRS